MRQLKKGDKVLIDGTTTIAQSACAYNFPEIIYEEKIKYDENTGKPFKIVKAYDDWWYAKDGRPYKGNLFYFIEKI